MASNVESLAAGFKGFDLMIKWMLDKLNSFEAWRTTTDTSLGVLLTETTEAAVRIDHLEAPPLPPPPHPPAGWLGGVDLNLAPQLGGRPFVSLGEWPSGQGTGGGMLGPPPPITHQGMPPDPSVHLFDVASGSVSHAYISVRVCGENRFPQV